MNKKMNKKGFTIVELVIVIAVIAILAAVMIPTFGGIIDTANESAVKQTATAAFKDLYGVDLSDGAIDKPIANGAQIDPDVAAAIEKSYKNVVTYAVSADGKTITFTYTDAAKGITLTTTDNGKTWN